MNLFNGFRNRFDTKIIPTEVPLQENEDVFDDDDVASEGIVSMNLLQ